MAEPDPELSAGLNLVGILIAALLILSAAGLVAYCSQGIPHPAPY